MPSQIGANNNNTTIAPASFRYSTMSVGTLDHKPLMEQPGDVNPGDPRSLQPAPSRLSCRDVLALILIDAARPIQRPV